MEKVTRIQCRLSHHLILLSFIDDLIDREIHSLQDNLFVKKLLVGVAKKTKLRFQCPKVLLWIFMKNNRSKTSFRQDDEMCQNLSKNLSGTFIESFVCFFRQFDSFERCSPIGRRRFSFLCRMLLFLLIIQRRRRSIFSSLSKVEWLINAECDRWIDLFGILLLPKKLSTQRKDICFHKGD